MEGGDGVRGQPEAHRQLHSTRTAEGPSQTRKVDMDTRGYSILMCAVGHPVYLCIHGQTHTRTSLGHTLVCLLLNQVLATGA